MIEISEGSGVPWESARTGPRRRSIGWKYAALSILV
jgi:hypothetical protein